MKRYRLFQAFVMAFYSRDLYRDVAKNWGGYTIIYLMLIVSLSWLAFAHRYHISANIMFDTLTQNVMTNLPSTLVIKEGIVQTPEEKPYVVKMEHASDPFIVIDTTSKNKNLSEVNSARILITQDQVTIRGNDEIRIYTIPKSLNRSYNLVKFNQFLKSAIPYLLVPIFIFLIIFSFVLRLVQVIFYAMIGKVIAVISGVSISYGAIYQIMMVALTPVITVNAIVEFMYIDVGHPYILNFLLGMFYLCFGIYANKNLSQ